MTFREQLEQARDGFAKAAQQNAEAGKHITAGENAARATVIDQILQMDGLAQLERNAKLWNDIQVWRATRYPVPACDPVAVASGEPI